EYPLGIGILGTLLTRAGHEVRIHDMAVDPTLLEEVVSAARPDITGLSFLSTSSGLAGEVLRQLADLPAGHLVAGGIHATIFPEHVLELGAHVVVRGEGEPVLIPLMDALSRVRPGGPYNEALSSVPGLAWRDGVGGFKSTAPAADDVDLDALPVVDRDLYDLARYPHHSVISSRACVHRCRFCCAWGPGGRRGRSASPARVAREFTDIALRYGPGTVYMADDMFFFDRRRRVEFCEILRSLRLPIRWVAQLRAPDLDPELAALMRDAGCDKVCIGAESGSDRVLVASGKGIRAKHIARAVAAARHAGLRIKTWWIVGLPGGDVVEERRTIELIERSRPDEVALHAFVPLPGSEFWDRARDHGIERPAMGSLERLFYYGSSGDLHPTHLPIGVMEALFEEFRSRLEDSGYVPAERATAADRYVYMSPGQARTFSV
ncbi:MAG: radical SAM protein, partial [Pseudomonadota bacterium]